MDIIYPKSDEIEPDVAKQLYEHHCAVLVIEGLPVNSEFGIDLANFQIGDKFKGVKLIPPGVHFVFASAISNRSPHQFGPRSGFFHVFRPKELVIKRWSPQDEDFDWVWQPNSDHLNRYQSNLRDLDRYLGAYRYSTYETFCRLTDHLVPDYLRAFLPETGRVVDTVIKFTKITPSKDNCKTVASSPDMITQYHLDTSMKLEQITRDKAGRDRLLCECQFAFVILILGHVYECFEHWKRILDLVCLADSAIDKYSDFFEKFARILMDQLSQVPEDMFEDVDSFENLIRCRLDTFFQNVEQCHAVRLKERVAELRRFAEEKFGWQFELERVDEQPVIVEL